MAKSKEPAEPIKAPAEPASAEDVALAVRATQDITGCGELAARDRVGKMDPDLVAKIAKLERNNKRIDIVAILYS